MPSIVGSSSRLPKQSYSEVFPLSQMLPQHFQHRITDPCEHPYANSTNDIFISSSQLVALVFVDNSLRGGSCLPFTNGCQLTNPFRSTRLPTTPNRTMISLALHHRDHQTSDPIKIMEKNESPPPETTQVSQRLAISTGSGQRLNSAHFTAHFQRCNRITSKQTDQVPTFTLSLHHPDLSLQLR